MKKLVVTFLMFSCVYVQAQNPKLIKNVAGTALEPNSTSTDFWTNNQWNGLFFYQGKGTPTKLCVTDGTDAGTKLISDIGTGAVHKIIPAKDFVYVITSTLVSASPFTTRFEIWKSNGTAAGTSFVITLPDVVGISNTNQFCSDAQSVFNFCLDGTTNKLFFSGYDASNGNELWATDGTAAGTALVKDIKPGTGGSIPWGFMKIGNDVFFNCAEVGLERKLWKTDGTAAGTVRINVAEPFFVVNGSIGKLGNKMIFFANNTTDGFEPYVSDGTPSGTFMLGNFNPSGNSLTPYVDEANMKSNSKYCFLILQNGTDTSLYRTDGTIGGTVRIAAGGMSVYTRVSSGGYSDVDENGIWVVQYNNIGSGNSEKIYRSNGTAAGTYLVAQNISYGQKVKTYKNALWMQARDIGANANSEPWRSGGNAATTNRAAEIAPGLAPVINTPLSADPYGFFVTNNKLYFFAKNAGGNAGLYEYNGDFTFNGSVTGGNWKDSANWNSAMPPGITDTVFVNTGTPNALTINGAKAYAGVLNMQSNAVINLSNATDSLFVNTRLASNTSNSFTGAGALVLRNTNADTIPINNGFNTSNLLIESNSNLLNGTIFISNALTLRNNGNLILNNNNLSLTGNTSTATASASSYVVTNGAGKMQIENIGAGARTGAVLFPVGTSTYNPVSLANSGTADVFGARVINGISTTYTGETPGALLTTAAVNRTWMITEGTSGGSNATITLQWNSVDELPSFDRNATVLGHYTGGAWTVGGTSAASGSNPYNFSRAGITSFSPFGILNSIATPVSNYWRNNTRLIVFPNPVKESVQVQLTEQMQKENLTLQLFNAQGQMVLQRIFPAARVSNIAVTLSSMSEGVYYLHLKGKTINASAVINKLK